MDDAIEQLVEHTRYRIGPAGRRLSRAMSDSLLRLVIRHWPHRHLEDIGRGVSRHHVAFDHAMALMRASVRERWEATHGVSPAWQLLCRPAVDAAGVVLLQLWWSSDQQRAAMRAMQRHLGER